MKNQMTAMLWHTTAAVLRKTNTKLGAVPHCLKVKTDRLGNREGEGAQISREVCGSGAKCR